MEGEAEAWGGDLGFGDIDEARINLDLTSEEIRRLATGSEGIFFSFNDTAAALLPDDEGLIDEECIPELSETEQLFLKEQALKEACDLAKPSPPLKDIMEKLTNVTDDGGVKKMVLKNGTGVTVPAGSKVFVHYVGFANESSQCFDSTLFRKRTHTIRLDEEGSCLVGLRLGLGTMEYREVARFVIQPRYGFGDLGIPPRVPPGATLIFHVALVRFDSPEKLKQIMYMPVEERNQQPFKEILESVKAIQMDGNTIYYQNNYQAAIRKYRKAAEILESFSAFQNEYDNLERDQNVASLYLNMAQCYLKQNKPEQACQCCKNALAAKCMEHAQKIYYRFAQAKHMLEDHVGALDLLCKARQFGKKYIEDIRVLDEKCRAGVVKQNEIYRNMFKDKPQKPPPVKLQPSEDEYFKMQESEKQEREKQEQASSDQKEQALEDKMGNLKVTEPEK